ncbi:pentapeptide repeat-containing protein [Gloeocapsopsis dulcis]|uniref:RDD domain-containing protein n=1 Tax=Gloeocapsopsis dulcis AAB1 = 1H9 TaxID=1433147 RepID=A0A6N8FX05_9CHRO|nr:pentapeptide repeat-containing protein [Gloeocapsopsis dulcis]MUL37650.1 hypothetical protein [Gloeocapsopsis dulcis AAB1 = 1H9]WNN89216.1 pentapeptide repeat-containing protein [Gloeocapsopsis dulcis]
MANSTVRRSVNRDRRVGQEKSKSLPLITRRFAAWTVEVSLIITSAVVPFGLGVYTQSHTEGTQPINPILATAKEAIATTLALPANHRNQHAPLTNWLWTGALVAPIVLSGWQLYLLAKTGSTLPKRWFGVRVVTAAGSPPGMRRILLREAFGAWLPLLVAYVLWHYSGAAPSLGMLAGFSLLTVLGEGVSARFNRYRRCWHDLLAGTYVVDANRSYAALLGNLRPATSPLIPQYTPYALRPVMPPAAMTTFVPPRTQRPHWWRWMRKNPGVALLFVTLSSMAAVLSTLVGTQVYIQTQANQRQLRQQNSQQFLALVQKLSHNAPTTLEERRKAITALGTLNDPQALQMLVDLLGQETDPVLLDTIQQTIASTGLRVIPHLRRSNQSLANALHSVRYSSKPEELTLHQQRLEATQRAIANLLLIYSGNLDRIDLSRTILGENLTDSALPFSLLLDNVDLSGIQLRGANLNQGSFRGTQWRSAGEDRRWNTTDDRIADLSDAQLKAANLTEADLSRILMRRTNLTHAILNRANLAGANLFGANLSSTQIVGANLRDVVLENASLTGSDLAATDLSRANLQAARLGRANALGTQMQYANVTASDWRGADLSGADFSHANLKNADLSDSRLSGVSFRNAQLQNTNLRNADLRQADLRGAQLIQTDMQGAILFKSPSQEQFIQIPPETTLSAIVEGVDFANAQNLDAKQLAYICTQGGRHPRCP